MAKEYKVKILKNGDKRYVFDVNIGYRADGSRIRKTVTAKTVKEGRQTVAELITTKANKTVISKNSLFKDIYQEYLTDCINKGYSKTTLDNKICYYQKKYTRFENVKIGKIRDIDLIEWIDELKKDLAPETVRTRESSLNAFFNWCIRKKYLEINPFNYIDKTKKTKPKLNFWTEEEFKIFIDTVDDQDYKLIYTTLFYTGLRKGEFCGLNIDDLNTAKNELHLSHTVKATNEGLIISNNFKNTNSKRIVPIPKWLTPQLYEFMKDKEYPFKRYYQLIGQRLREKYLHNVNLPKIRVHDLRHSYVSMLINKGVDIYTISQMVGHGDIKTTINTYGDLYPDKRAYITSLFD